MIQLLGLFLIIIALKLVVNTNSSPIALSINTLLDSVIPAANDEAVIVTNSNLNSFA